LPPSREAQRGRTPGAASTTISCSSTGKGDVTGRAAVGYDHGYDAEVFYLRLALDPLMLGALWRAA